MITLIFLPFTLVTGFFGMNNDFVKFFKHPVYLIAFAIMFYWITKYLLDKKFK
ncbi:CorA family divalent cation transporter [Bacillus sp. SCS-153A]